MEKERYTKNIRDYAWHLIIKHRICRLPLDVYKFAEGVGILTVPYTRLSELTGMTIMRIEEEYSKAAFYYHRPPERVYFNDTLENTGFLRFSVMHEISHLLLMHIEDDAEREKEAKMLAARLLEPLIVLDRCGVMTADELANLCGVSREAAGYRFARLEEKRCAGTVGMSRLERQVGDQFADFIQEYKLANNR